LGDQLDRRFQQSSLRRPIACPLGLGLTCPAICGCLERKNGLGRTTANNGGGWFVTRYDFSKKVRLSRLSAAGNLAGKSRARFRNAANLLRRFLEFRSCPGHQVFLIFSSFYYSLLWKFRYPQRDTPSTVIAVYGSGLPIASPAPRLCE